MGRYEADHILFGAAYYDEYLMMKGIDRIDEDMAMMKDAGLNVIRIAESTWSTCEPQPGVFDFTYVDRALDAAQRAGIDVIVGTPTYAVPSWLVKLDPSVLAVTPNGQGKYGARQMVVPEKLRTLDHGRPWSDDQFASTRLSSNRDMSR